MKFALPFLASAMLASPAAARPVLLELFTSQSCSSCPPAEALLGVLKARPDVVALEFHVDYWNALNWRDPYSAHAFTNRQRDYAAALGTEVFTPQIVIDGRRSAVGSDRSAIGAAIQAARDTQPAGPVLGLARQGRTLTVTVGAGNGAAAVLLAGYDPAQTTSVPSGENGGAVLNEVNVVRSLRKLGDWNGQALTLSAVVPAGERFAVVLQAADGAVLGTVFPG
jgi:hypothetical protein